MRLLLATLNKGKIAQIREKLADLPCEIVTCEDLGCPAPEVEESGATLDENALLKARAFFEAAKGCGADDVAVLADDGGLFIDALNGEPGMYAKRWAGEGAGDEGIIQYTLKRMEGVPMEKRTAEYRVTQALIEPDGTEHLIHGTTKCEIADRYSPPKYPGLPYGALMVVKPFGKLYDDLTGEEKLETHRAKALAAVREHLFSMIQKYA